MAGHTPQLGNKRPIYRAVSLGRRTALITIEMTKTTIAADTTSLPACVETQPRRRG